MSLSLFQRALIVVSTACLVAAIPAGCGGGKSTEEKANDALSRGLQAHAAGQLDVAEAAYREVLNLDPQNKYALYDLGLIDQTRGDLISAENRYRLALNQDPNFESALFNLAIVRNDSGSPLEAIVIYSKITLLNPANASAHLNLGYALISVGRQDEGDTEIQRARDLNPALAAPPPPAAGPSGSAAPTTVGTSRSDLQGETGIEDVNAR